MFLVAAILLSIITWTIAWSVSYSLANPREDFAYSKTVGWLTGMAALPTLGASIYCAYAGHGQASGITFAVVNLVGIIVASPAGEKAGKRAKEAA